MPIKLRCPLTKRDHMKPYTLVVCALYISTRFKDLHESFFFSFLFLGGGGLGTMAPYNLFIETTYYNITQHVKHVLFLILIELTPTLSSTLSTNWDLSKNLHLVLSFKNQKNYTKYGIYVTLVTFWMTFLMNNWEILSWMMDEFMHWPKPYLLLLATFDEILSWKIEIWIKKSLGKWQ